MEHAAWNGSNVTEAREEDLIPYDLIQTYDNILRFERID